MKYLNIHIIIILLSALCGVEGRAQMHKDSLVHRPSVWVIDGPLGEHKSVPMDTLLYNYQRQAVPSLVSDAYATTGNLGGEGQNQIFFSRPAERPFFFLNSLYPWLPTDNNQRFYNVYIPFTQLSYNTGGDKNSTQDRLRMEFAGNAGRRVGIEAKMDYLYSKGSYSNQATKDFTFGFSGYYKGERYQMQAYYNHWNLLNKENGGITDPLYITDPAVLQGGVGHIDHKSIPVNLSAAHSRVNGQKLYVNQAYNVGFWRQEEVNDTLIRDVYVPVTKFVLTTEYESGHHMFLNKDVGQDLTFWPNHYLSADGTRNDSRYTSFANTLGISMIEGFQKWAKFGLSAYARYDVRRYSLPSADNLSSDDSDLQTLTPLPEGFSIKPKQTENLLWAGANLSKRRGSILTYAADFRIGLAGPVAADVELKGDIGTRIPLLGDTVPLQAHASFTNLAPPYLLKHYISNHFAWDNDFGKTRTLRIGGEILVPWSGTNVSADYQSMQNYVYFNTDGCPAQYGGSIHVLALNLDQRLRAGIWHWDNRLTFQTTSKSEVLPLPVFTIYSNMYLWFRAFRVLDVQLGVDCDYYTRYHAPAYQPATMTFHVQNDVKLGNYAFMNLYATCKLQKARFFVMMSHINQGWFGKNYFSSPLYPLNPRKFQLGISVDFAN